MNKLSSLLLICIVCWGCAHTGTEKHQNKRDNVINVREKVKEIAIKDVLFGSIIRLYLMDNYLIIGDYAPMDKLIHIFDKNNFSYVTSIVNKGKGPGEIVNMGHIGIDEARHKFYVSDHGKQCVFSYDLDSVLTNPSYMPVVKMRMNESLFPTDYQFFNDTLCFGRIIKPIGNNDFDPTVAKWNMLTGEIKPMKYKNPNVKKRRIMCTVSMEQGIYVECYYNYDLMTICSLAGDLKYNVYGPNWDSQSTGKIHHYGPVVFCSDRIFASYSGGNNDTDEYHPTKILVFNTSGDYLQTLETEYWITDFCFDKENNRLILSLNDEMQFAYLELDGLTGKP